MLLAKAKLAKQAKEIAILQESDDLRNAILNSVSHELRTPLAGIMGAVYTLQDGRIECDASMQSQLLRTITESGKRMEHIIENLLDTARITSGMVKLKRDWCDLEEIIGGALSARPRYAVSCPMIYPCSWVTVDFWSMWCKTM